MARNVFDQRLTTLSQQAPGVSTLSLPYPITLPLAKRNDDTRVYVQRAVVPY
jgi:hypothetical protein